MFFQTVLALITLLMTINTEANEASTFRVSQHLLINREKSIPPSRICHDNLYLYFKDEDSCRLSEYDPLICEKTLRIIPIREIEHIDLNRTDQKKLIRGHKVNLEYEEWIYEETQKSTFSLVKVEEKKLSLCTDRPEANPRVIFSDRQTHNDEEHTFLSGVIESGINWISTGPGIITNVSDFETSSDDIITSMIQSKRSERTKNIRSPYCNRKIPRSLTAALGGERSGTGFYLAAFDVVEFYSKEIDKAKAPGAAITDEEFQCKSSETDI